MLGDASGPQHTICLACVVPQRDDDGDVIRDAAGHVLYRCGECLARYVDRWCECWLCPWLKEIRR